MQNIYKLALQVQDASNINGVIRSLQLEVIPAVHEETGYREQGTSYVQNHPAVVLFIYKLADMAGIITLSGDSENSYFTASAACEAKA